MKHQTKQYKKSKSDLEKVSSIISTNFNLFLFKYYVIMLLIYTYFSVRVTDTELNQTN